RASVRTTNAARFVAHAIHTEKTTVRNRGLDGTFCCQPERSGSPKTVGASRTAADLSRGRSRISGATRIPRQLDDSLPRGCIRFMEALSGRESVARRAVRRSLFGRGDASHFRFLRREGLASDSERLPQ